MGVVAIDRERIEMINNPARDRVYEMTGYVNQLTYLVKTQWDELRQEDRDLMKALVYLIIGQAQPSLWEKIKRFFLGLIGKVFLFGLEKKTLLNYGAAVHKLVEAVLDAIELENEEYKRAISEALDSSLDGSSGGILKGMKTADFKPGGARDWLESL